jgi:hypothetical protein
VALQQQGLRHSVDQQAPGADGGASSLSQHAMPDGQLIFPPRESLQHCHSSGAAASPSATVMPLNACHRDTPPANDWAIWSMSQAFFVATARPGLCCDLHFQARGLHARTHRWDP